MQTVGRTRTHFLIRAWTTFVVLAIYLPIACGALAGLSKGRYFAFPIRIFSTEWWGKTWDSFEIHVLVQNSVLIALIVTVLSVLFAFFGALAFARYPWKGRRAFQRLLLLPIFFPQPVLGLALLLWFNALGIFAPLAGLPFLLLEWGGGLSFMSYVGHVLFGFILAYVFERREAAPAPGATA